MAEAISKRGDSCERRRNEKSRVAKTAEGNRARDATDEEAGDNDQAQSLPPHVHGQTAQRMAEKDAEVCKHARKMGGADDCAAVSAHHRVLQSAGAGRGIDAEDVVALEERDGDAKENGLQKQSDAVTASELKRAVLNEKAAEHRSGNERADDGSEVKSRRTIERCQRRREHGSSTGKMSDGLMLEAQQPNDVDDAGDES